MELRFAAQKKLDNFSLEMDFTVEGDRIGIFGPSGCGKSTLVSLIAGLHRPDRGCIQINGGTVFDGDKRINVPIQQRRIGMVFQRPHLFPHLSVKANLLYGYKRCASDQRKIILENVIDVLQIGNLLHRGVNNLSGGEKQRVAIGRAVLSNPRMLIMDEPLSALDDNLKFQIIPFLKKSCEAFKIPYLFISHSLTEMRIMASRVLNIADGRITGLMTPEELARDSMGKGPLPYMNMLKLGGPSHQHGLYAYQWGNVELLISGGRPEETIYELPSTDIILFKRHPEAISARNLLKCRVGEIFQAGRRIGVELMCGDEKLVAEIVKESVTELNVREGMEIFAAIKATAFRQLG